MSSERPIGAMGGAGYVPWSKIIAYAEREGISSPDEQDRLCRMMREMDGEYLAWLAEKQKTSPSPDK